MSSREDWRQGDALATRSRRDICRELINTKLSGDQRQTAMRAFNRATSPRFVEGMIKRLDPLPDVPEPGNAGPADWAARVSENERIREAYLRGDRLQAIADRHGLSTGHIGRICRDLEHRVPRVEEEERQEMRSMYLRGFSREQIAQHFERSHTCVWHHTKDLGS